MTQLRDNPRCYACGKDNPLGLHMTFEVDESAKTIRGRFTPRPGHQGYEGIVHGGVIATLLDEAMAKLAWRLGMPAVSAELTVKFKSPAAPEEELSVTGRITNEVHGLIEAEAKVERGVVVIAEAKGKLLKVG
jgi:acyl-coenzyme A thioesterase PaaI-like protein